LFQTCSLDRVTAIKIELFAFTGNIRKVHTKIFHEMKIEKAACEILGSKKDIFKRDFRYLW
jgi:hypothetical protein